MILTEKHEKTCNFLQNFRDLLKKMDILFHVIKIKKQTNKQNKKKRLCGPEIHMWASSISNYSFIHAFVFEKCCRDNLKRPF